MSSGIRKTRSMAGAGLAQWASYLEGSVSQEFDNAHTPQAAALIWNQ